MLLLNIFLLQADLGCGTVTEQVLSEVIRKMPVKDGQWKQILKECFGLTESDIYKAEYACKTEGLEVVISRLLLDWQHRQPKPATRKQMFEILTSEKGKDICKDLSWCEFLVTGVHNDHNKLCNEIEHDPVRDFLISELNHPLYWHMLIMSMVMYLYYMNLEFSHYQEYRYNIWTIEKEKYYVFILPLLVFGDYNFLKLIEKYLFGEPMATNQTLPLNICGLVFTYVHALVAAFWGRTIRGF